MHGREPGLCFCLEIASRNQEARRLDCRHAAVVPACVCCCARETRWSRLRVPREALESWPGICDDRAASVMTRLPDTLCAPHADVVDEAG